MALDLIPTQTEGEHDTATATATNKPQYLGCLAAEIQIDITKNLEKKDLRSLRLVNRSLGTDTFDVFAEKNFSNLSCRFNTQSLENVRNVSAAPQFARHVKTIEFYAGRGYETGLLWPRFVPRLVSSGRTSQLPGNLEIRTQKINDMLLKDIFSNFARCGSAKCVGVSITDDFFVPAVHALAIALNTSGHSVEELHCSVDKLPQLLEETETGRCNYAWDFKLASAFSQIAKHSWSKLRAMHFICPAAGVSWPYVVSALRSLIEAASSLQELTLQLPLQDLREVRRAVTDRQNLRVLKLLGNGKSCDYVDIELHDILSAVYHSLETLMLEDIMIFTNNDDHWKGTLAWLSHAPNLRCLSCQNLRSTTSPSFSSWLLLDGKGDPQFEVEGSKEEVKEKLSTLVAEAGRRQDLEVG
ncbi:unnamed protein product [Cercospora beticola]|nr:unnamed protein product [Cercospora beticola]